MVWVITGTEKLIQMEPWMVSTSKMGRPADLKVKSKITMTNKAVRMLIFILSPEKELARSKALVELPTSTTSSP